MSNRRTWWSLVLARRAVQLAALLLFFGCLLTVRARPDWVPEWTTTLFFRLDPLIALVTGVAARAWPTALALAILVALLTALFGRLFCGWFCPLGTLHAIAGRLLNWIYPRKNKEIGTYSPWQRAKYYVLIASLFMAILGSNWICIFDPIVLLTRSTATALFPGTQWAVEEGSTAIWQADPHIGSLHLTSATEPVYGYLRDNVFGVPKLAFLGSGLIFAFLLFTLLLNRVKERFWCRYVCPLGGLLGFLAWRPLLRRQLAEGSCTNCNLCNHACSGGTRDGAADVWRPSECFGCMKCASSCAPNGLSFVLALPWHHKPRVQVQPMDLSRRAVLGSTVGGAISLCLLRSTPQSRERTFHPALIRPPGARSEAEFLRRCTSCGLCMKVCITGGLQPTLMEAGIEGLWTPRLVPTLGPCDYTCNLCGQVCPTQAIEPLPLEKKKEIKIGLATFDTTRCIPYAFGRNCSVCEEHCPIPAKAIYTLEVEVTDRSGMRHKILQPQVDPDKCTGCGICENVCPFKDLPAIRITSANETRHASKNQPILPNENMVGLEGY